MMSELEIYDQPDQYNEVKKTSMMDKIRGYGRRGLEKTADKFSGVTALYNSVAEKEQQILRTVHPVTKYVPVEYDTVKRTSVVGICTLYGVLLGRHRGGLKKYITPAVWMYVGSAACFPKRTYHSTVTVATTALPLIATTGKATAEAATATAYHVSKVSSFLYTKIKEKIPDKPAVKENTIHSVETTETVMETTETTMETNTQESPPIIDSKLDSVTIESIVEDVAESDCEPPFGPSVESIVEAVEEQVSIVPTNPTDKIIPLEQLTVPVGEVEKIPENLGMGDKEHDDMYSTRSARS